jgi:uncharacterized coiled-coil DUF342 family protein
LERQIKQATADLAALGEQKLQATKAAADAMASRDAAQKEIDATQGKRAALDQQMKDLRAQIEQGKAELATLTGKVQGARQELAQVEAKIKAEQPQATPTTPQPQTGDAPK